MTFDERANVVSDKYFDMPLSRITDTQIRLLVLRVATLEQALATVSKANDTIAETILKLERVLW